MQGKWHWIGLGIVLGLSHWPAWSADPDPEAVRRLMEKYRREAEAEKHPPAPKPVAKPAPKKPAVNHDREAWKSAEKCGTAACFEAYLADYPKGRYARMARARLKSTSAPRTPTVAPVTSLRRSSIEPAMVRIKGDCFQMGSTAGEAGRGSDERQRWVCVKDFALGQYEVTVGEFRRFVDATDYRTDAERNADGEKGCFITYQDGGKRKYGYRSGYSWKNPNFEQSDRQPVVCVSWNDANAYVKWLTEQTGQSYRLPTEAEWEYAARAGTTTARYWGNNPDQTCRYANVADQTMEKTFSGWTIHDCTDGFVYTAPVGTFKPNGWKLYDLLGNVWEWTCSAYKEDYDGSEKQCTSNNHAGPRSLRGGSWFNSPVMVRSANRDRLDPAYRNFAQGFRLARSL